MNKKVLKKVIINHSGMKKYSCVLPNGDSVLITQDSPYLTSKMEDLLFFSKQKYIALIDPTDAEYKELLLNPRYLPEVKNILNLAEAKPFVWKDEMEDEVKKKLEELGYICCKEDELPKVEIKKDISIDEMVKLLKDKGYNVSKKSKKGKVEEEF